MSSFLGLLIVGPRCAGSRCRGVFDDGVAADLALTDRGELSTLGAALPLVDRESSVPDRRAYGSAVAGRVISGRRGLEPGRMGADDREETWDPVGTVRTAEAEDLPGGSVVLASEKVDCADSGRGGKECPGVKRALFCAAIASFRAERLAMADDVLLERPFRDVDGVFDEVWSAFGFAGSLSNRDLDLLSRLERMLFQVRFYIEMYRF